MSDAFDFSNVDPSVFDSPPDFTPNLPTSSAGGGFPDLSSLFGPSSGAPLLPPVLNLPQPASAGVSGIVNDLTRLVTGVYAGEAQVLASQNALALAKARAANQLETVKTTPNIWLVLGLGAAGLFALELADRGKK